MTMDRTYFLTYMKSYNKKIKIEYRRFINNERKRLGGACFDCGRKTNLVFHHANPSTKSFEMADARRLNKSFKEIRQEVDKCWLLCRKCHPKYHRKTLCA